MHQLYPQDIDELMSYFLLKKNTWANPENNLNTYQLKKFVIRPFKDTQDKFAVILIIKQIEIPTEKNINELVNFFDELLNNIGIASKNHILIPYLIVDATEVKGTNVSAANRNVAHILERIERKGGKIYIASDNKMVLLTITVLNKLLPKEFFTLKNLDEDLFDKLNEEKIDMNY